MTNSDRQRLKILAILLAVLCSSLWVRQKLTEPPKVLESFKPIEIATASTKFQITDGWRISEKEEVHGLQLRNPFDYGFDSAAPVSSNTLPEVVPETPSPEISLQPPSIPFKYNGYAIIEGEEVYMVALLFEGDESFSVSANEILMGRYLVKQITETFVEIEDLEFGHRRNLPLSMQ